MAMVLRRPQWTSLPGAVLECCTMQSRAGASQAMLALSKTWSITQRRTAVTMEQLDREKGDRERVLILGSGWGGYGVSRNLDTKKFQVVLVSPRSYFVFTPLLASTAVGTLEFRTALEPVRHRGRELTFYQGWADDVDLERKMVTVEENVMGREQGVALAEDTHKFGSPESRDLPLKKHKGHVFDVPYDKLILTVGCYSQTFNTPGVKENALFLKDVGDARKIRKRLLECFETAALPTTTEQMKQNLLNFAVVGGGPTGIEFSAEMHDLIHDDLSKIYPELVPYVKITVYDVAPKVLSMFDESLGQYAVDIFRREGIAVKTSHHIESLRPGLPRTQAELHPELKSGEGCLTLTNKEEGEVAIGMCVWSTGLMMNPFVVKALDQLRHFPSNSAFVQDVGAETAPGSQWLIKKDPRTGGLVTDDHLRVMLEAHPTDPGSKGKDQKPKQNAILRDVFAIGDCAVQASTMLPATAQVANQKARWLGRHLSRGTIDRETFSYRDLGVMAYIGNWNAIMQSGGGNGKPGVTGRVAWILWRTAYLSMSVSLRNKILIPTYWFINWIFGRDISRF